MKKRSFLLIALSLMATLCLALYASCEKTDGAIDATVSFEIGVDGYAGEGVADQQVAIGSSVTLPEAPVIEYYAFDYWQLGADKYNVGDTVGVDSRNGLTFTAVYSEAFVLSYSVADGLEAPQSQSGRVGEEVTLATGEDNGYSEFTSWVIDGNEYDSGAVYTPVHGANNVIANYTDTFVLTYAVPEEISAPAAVAGVVGENIILADGPERYDYEFEGWMIDGELYPAGAEYVPALGAVTATAQYKLLFAYVTFEIEDGSAIEGEVGAPLRMAVGSKLAESDIPALTAKEFNIFGWYVGDEAVDPLDLEITENVTVTAKSVYVGSPEEAFTFIPVEDTGYAVMASAEFAQYIENGRLGIPANHNGLPVVAIADGESSENAFGNTAAAGLTYVYIPASVTSIGSYAFYNNATLAAVVYEQGAQLANIGAYAFRGCAAISNFSDSEENVGLYIPAGVKVIDDYAFYGIAPSKREVMLYFDVENGQLETIGAYAFSATGTNAASAGGITIGSAFPSTLKEIGERAFHCNVLGMIDFGENATITTIGDHAFANTGNLDVSTVSEVKIPKSVTTLGVHVFQNSKQLVYVEFEEGSPIEALPEYTFSGCAALEEVVFPSGLKEIGVNAFASCFANANDGKGIDMNGEDGNFVLPEGVTVLPANVFAGSKFNNAVIPSTILEIGASAFGTSGSNYTSFNSLTFEDGENGLVIGEKAFNSQNIHLALTIPARVTSIGAYAFWKANLTSIVFEEGDLPLVISDNAFNSIGSAAGTNLSTSKTLYPFTATSITLPARTESIGVGAFAAQLYLQELNFAEGYHVAKIPNYAFAYCSSLRSINIPECTTKIGQYAFTVYSLANIKDFVYNYGVKSETSHKATDIYIDIDNITIPANVESIDTYAFYNRGLKLSSLVFEGTNANKDLTIAANSFGILADYASALDSTNKGNVTLESVKFPANLVSVGGLFLNGSIANITSQYLNLSSIDLDDCSRLTTLGDNFMAGTSLTNVSIPDSVTTIGNYVFANKMVPNGDYTETMQFGGEIILPANLKSLGTYFCAAVSGVTSFKIDDSNANYKTVDGVIFSKDGATLINYPFGKKTESYVVPEGCTTIADGAFKSNPNIKSINFNEVTTINGTYTFAKTHIQSIDHTFESVGDYAFLGCADLTTVNIDIKSNVPAYLFQNCTSLKTVTLGENISELGNFIFSGCAALDTINFSAKITKVGNSAFNGCKALVSMDFSDATSIGTNVFQNASNIKTVTLGAVTSIPVNAFGNTSLKSLTIKGDVMATLKNTNAFTGVTGATVYVKAELIESYNADSNWSTLVENGTLTFAAIPEAKE